MVVIIELDGDHFAERRQATEKSPREKELATVTATPETWSLKSLTKILLLLIAIVRDSLEICCCWSLGLYLGLTGSWKQGTEHLGKALQLLVKLDIMFDCVEALGVGAGPLFDVSTQSSCMLRKASSFFPGFLWSNSTCLQCKSDVYEYLFNYHWCNLNLDQFLSMDTIMNYWIYDRCLYMVLIVIMMLQKVQVNILVWIHKY